MSVGRWLARLAVVAAIGGLLPIAAGAWWGIELLSHFRVQYLVVALPVMIAALALRKRIPALLLAVAIGLNAWPLIPYVRFYRAPPVGSPFDVLNINVNASNQDRAAIVGSITAAEPDLVVVVELTPETDRALAALADYPHRLAIPETHSFGIGLLSRYPLDYAHAVSLSGTPAIDARIRLPYGALRFVGVHLVPPMSREAAAERNRQLDELAALVGRSEEPVIVCGDFNLTPYSPYFTQFTRATGLTDTRLRLGFDFSWPTGMPLLRIPIDHCLVRGPVEAESVERMEQMGSDHYPVRIRLLWQTPQ